MISKALPTVLDRRKPGLVADTLGPPARTVGRAFRKERIWPTRRRAGR